MFGSLSNGLLSNQHLGIIDQTYLGTSALQDCINYNTFKVIEDNLYVKIKEDESYKLFKTHNFLKINNI